MLKRLVSLLILLVLTACSACGATTPHTEMPTSETKDSVMLAFEKACKAAEVRHIDYACKVAVTPIDDPDARGYIAGIHLLERHIKYGRLEMGSIETRYGFWANVYIFGHELGHLYDYKTGIIYLMTSHQAELSADELGGCFLAMAGGEEEELEQALHMIRSLFDESDTHPGPARRMAAAKKGYEDCHESAFERIEREWFGTSW